MTTQTPCIARIFTLWVISVLVMPGCSITARQSGKEVHSDAGWIEPVAQEKAPAAPVVVQPAQLPGKYSPFVHTVKYPGESLSYISKWYTGRFANWKLVAHANPDIDPDRIRKGDKIVIPQKLLNQRNSLPKDFVSAMSLKTTANERTKETASKEKEWEALPLFGPK
jgi:hypothetical protein